MVNDHGQTEKVDVGGDGGLSAEALLRCAGEAGEAGDTSRKISSFAYWPQTL